MRRDTYFLILKICVSSKKKMRRLWGDGSSPTNWADVADFSVTFDTQRDRTVDAGGGCKDTTDRGNIPVDDVERAIGNWIDGRGFKTDSVGEFSALVAGGSSHVDDLGHDGIAFVAYPQYE